MTAFRAVRPRKACEAGSDRPAYASTSVIRTVDRRAAGSRRGASARPPRPARESGPRIGQGPAPRTVPAEPSTRTRSPSGARVVALPQPTTAGIPSSRATIAAWDSGAPTSVTTAAGAGEQRRPAHVGDVGDQHLTGLQPVTVGRVGQDHPGDALHHPGRAGEPGDRRRTCRRRSGRRRDGRGRGSAGRRVRRPRERVEPAADQPRAAAAGPRSLRTPSVGGRSPRGPSVSPPSTSEDLAGSRKKMSSPSPVSCAGPEHEGPQHPEVADHLAAGELAVAGDPAPLLTCRRSSQACSGYRCSSRIQASSRSGAAARPAAPRSPVRSRGSAGPAGSSIQTGSSPDRGSRDLELVRSAVAVPLVEGVLVDRAGASGPARRAGRGWPADRPSAQAGGDRVGSGVADHLLQPLPGGDEGRPTARVAADSILLTRWNSGSSGRAQSSASTDGIVDRGDLGRRRTQRPGWAAR